MKSFPPLPTEFEVASLKPSAPDTGGGRGATGSRPDVKNGRLYLPRISLKNLITVAWDLNGDDMLVGAPKWLDEDRYDIVAKAPAGVALGDLTPTRTGIPVNLDALRPMIRALIVERFKLDAHMENRPVNAYTLIATKQPKLKKADPTTRTKWQEGAPGFQGRQERESVARRLVTCQNVTMAQFAELLPESPRLSAHEVWTHGARRRVGFHSVSVRPGAAIEQRRREERWRTPAADGATRRPSPAALTCSTP
jgi:uncharacterized protein (TIGR03435 family)